MSTFFLAVPFYACIYNKAVKDGNSEFTQIENCQFIRLYDPRLFTEEEIERIHSSLTILGTTYKGQWTIADFVG